MAKIKYDLERFKNDLRSSTAKFMIDLLVATDGFGPRLYYDELIAMATMERAKRKKPHKLRDSINWAEYLREMQFFRYNKNFGTIRLNLKFMPKNQLNNVKK